MFVSEHGWYLVVCRRNGLQKPESNRRANYPETPKKGDVISGLPKEGDDTHVFHAGTAEQDGKIVTAGGRVLCVTALGDNVKQAQKHAYDAITGIHFDGMQYRRDIGHRAITR